MAYEIRFPGPIGQIWRALFFIVLVALLWWREMRLGRTMENDISSNKAVFSVLWRMVDLALLRCAR
jgi:hypothetical protein